MQKAFSDLYHRHYYEPQVLKWIHLWIAKRIKISRRYKVIHNGTQQQQICICANRTHICLPEEMFGCVYDVRVYCMCEVQVQGSSLTKWEIYFAKRLSSLFINSAHFVCALQHLVDMFSIRSIFIHFRPCKGAHAQGTAQESVWVALLRLRHTYLH